MKKFVMKKQRGATLLEALAFLGIAAIVVVGAISMFRAAQGSAQSNDMLAQITGIRSAVKNLYASQGAYGGAAVYGTTGAPPAAEGDFAMNTTLVSAKVIPDTLRVPAAGTIKSQFGGDVVVMGGIDYFTIKYTQVPQEVCLKIAPQTGSAWGGLKINGNASVGTDTSAFSVVNAQAQCTPGTSNTLIWFAR